MFPMSPPRMPPPPPGSPSSEFAAAKRYNDEVEKTERWQMATLLVIGWAAVAFAAIVCVGIVVFIAIEFGARWLLLTVVVGLAFWLVVAEVERRLP